MEDIICKQVLKDIVYKIYERERKRLYRNTKNGKAAAKKYGKSQKGKISARKRKERYKRTLKGKKNMKSYSRYKSGAKSRALEFSISKEYFENLQSKPCFYCNYFDGVSGIDRVKNELGYFVGNCVSCCSICNAMKSKLSFEQFIKQCKHIATIQFTHDGKDGRSGTL